MKRNCLVMVCLFFVAKASMPTYAMVDGEIDKISAKYNLDINNLKTYYYRLQLVSRYIFDMLLQSGIAGMRNKLSEAIIPGRNQIEATGGAALEVYNGLPHGFWTPLGFLPVCEGGTGGNRELMVAIMNEIARKLKLIKLFGAVTDTWGSGNYVCKVGQDLAGDDFSNVCEVPGDRMISPTDIFVIWAEVKPGARACPNSVH